MQRQLLPRRAFVRAALAATAALTSACSPLGLVNALVPSDGYRSTADIRYGAHARQLLDVYRPATETSRAPVVVFFYGGNWSSGDRASYRFAGEALASQGFVAVIPDYRLYPEVRFPDFLADCAAAVRWAFDHAANHGGDPSRIFLMGHSAGAYNAAMLGLDAQYLMAAGVDHRRIRGLVGLAGPYDFLPLTGDVSKAVFGYPDTSPRTQPINFSSSDDPPALLVTGDADRTVDPGNSARLAARLRKNGVEVKEIVYPDISHTRVLGALAAPFRGWAPVLDDVSAFVRSRSAPR